MSEYWEQYEKKTRALNLEWEKNGYFKGYEVQQIFEGDAYEGFQKIENQWFSELPAFPHEILMDRIRRSLEKKQSKHGGDIYFITINPRQDVDFEAFKDKVEYVVKRPFLKSVSYTFEQRGKTLEEKGKGFHVHIISEKLKGFSPAQLQQNIYSTFKNFVGNKLHIDIKKYPLSFRKEKIQYLNGEKWDPVKEASIEINKIWRAELNLLDIYNI